MKPAPYPVLARQLGVPPHEVMYVSDNPQKDLVGIKPVGFRTVRILRGNYAHLEARCSSSWPW